MKKLLTNNLGLKILSVLAAIVIWLVIVNIDDPVIKKSFSGIQVEIINENAISSMDKTYEVLDGSDIVTATVTAKRSVIESLSRDYIKATADLKQLSFMNTVPIEFKAVRFGDQIESITSRTSNIQVEIENRLTKQIRVNVDTDGEVQDGYVIGKITPNVNVISVTGPESVINNIVSAKILIDINGMNENFVNSVPVQLWGGDEMPVVDDAVTCSMTEIRTEVEILETKEIPIIASSTGVPSQGFSTTGIVICDPSSVTVAGAGSKFDNLSSITIPSERVNVDGATENTTVSIDISKYLPKDIKLADENDTGVIDVTVVVEAHEINKVVIQPQDIKIDNLPEGYKAQIINTAASGIEISVSGLAEDLTQLNGWKITGITDAKAFVSEDSSENEESEEDEEDEEDETAETEQDEITTGINKGIVLLNLPDGVIQAEPVVIEVLVEEKDYSEEAQ